MPKALERNREKISATLSADLVRRVQDYQREAELPSFSAALEQLLWREFMEEQTRAYYASMSPDEEEEQARWAAFATAQAGKVFSRDE